MIRWLLAALFTVLHLVQPLSAHESRPAYLDIRELGSGQYEVIWKRPMRGEYVIGFAVVWPEGCAPTSEAEHQVPGASLTRMRVDCGAAGLVGRELSIARLPETSAEVLVRVEFMDGSTETRILRPSAAAMTVQGPRGALAIAAEYATLGFE
ncbi:MAG: hypothetical protein WAK98_03895, partial [Gemmobacter sp.]